MKKYMDINTIDVLEKCNDKEIELLIKELEENKYEILDGFIDGDFGFTLYENVSSMYTMSKFKNEVYREAAIRFCNSL